MNDKTLAALERAAVLIEADDWSPRSKDAALIRALIERERAGGERAQIVALQEEVALLRHAIDSMNQAKNVRF